MRQRALDLWISCLTRARRGPDVWLSVVTGAKPSHVQTSQMRDCSLAREVVDVLTGCRASRLVEWQRPMASGLDGNLVAPENR